MIMMMMMMCMFVCVEEREMLAVSRFIHVP